MNWKVHIHSLRSCFRFQFKEWPAVFRQGTKGKAKAVVDAKGKDKEILSPSSSVKPETAQLGATVSVDANDTRGPEVGHNGALAMDVEMDVQDVTERGPLHDVNAVLPME